MSETTLSLLHVSDLHDRGPRERETWRRRRVLGEAWERNLDEIREEGPLDLVCFTGDAAFSGKADEYARVTEFFQAMLERLGLGWERFFVVPGNHDVDRTIAKPTWKRLREKLPQADRSRIARWLTGGPAPLGFQDREREQVLERQAAYREWVMAYLRRPDLDPGSSSHGRLGYRQTLRLPGHPCDLHILGLDSAWMCGDDHDAGKLWLTDEQVMRLATDEAGNPLSGFRLCLVHHPLEELADGGEVRRLLAERVDLLLRGHLHDPERQTWEDPERSLAQVAAGCLYEHDTYPNACEVVRATLDDDRGRPLGYDLWFRGWSKRGYWFDDNSLYRGTVDGRLRWRREEPPAAGDTRVARVGREPESKERMKVFISHSSADRQAAKVLVELLQTAMPIEGSGIRCTSLAGYGLEPGVDFNERLRRETYEAEVLLGLLSPNALRSTYVLFELGARWAAKAYMIPVLLGGLKAADLPGPVAALHAIDARNAQDLEALVGAVGNHLNLPIVTRVPYRRYAARMKAALTTLLSKEFPSSQIEAELQKMKGEIMSPRDMAMAPQRLRVSGKTLALADGYEPWLLVWAPNEQIYPQVRLSYRIVEWVAEVRIGRVGIGLDNGFEYVVELAAAGADTNYRFEKYLRGESESKDGLGTLRPGDLIELDSKRVIRTG
jgi:TIR domain-containing protein/calcineurin-like phosphoesterase family protein